MRIMEVSEEYAIAAFKGYKILEYTMQREEPTALTYGAGGVAM